MRILHFYRTFFPDSMGGIEQVIYQLARGARKLGFDVDILSLTRDPAAQTLEIDGCLAHKVHQDFEIASTGFSVAAFSRFSQLARQADVIHYHFPWPFMDVVHFATRVRKPTVVTYQSDIIRQKRLLNLYRPLMNRFLQSVDSIVATSPNYLATSEVLHHYADKVKVIPIGLDKTAYPQPLPGREQFWSEKFGRKFFLFVGVLRYYKGLHVLLAAMQGTDYPVVIVGAGPIEEELRSQAERLGVRNIHFLGYLPDDDRAALLQLCYAVVFPSHLRSEAFGISLLEGAMYGKPLISSEIGTGTTFINVAGETGLVVAPGDPSALRQAMDHLWEHPDLAAEMGRKAEARYWRYFTAERMAAEYAELYRELAGQ